MSIYKWSDTRGGLALISRHVISYRANKFVRITTEERYRAKVERAFFVVVFVTYRYVKPASSKYNESLTTGIHGARPFAQVICKNHPPSTAEIQEAEDD